MSDSKIEGLKELREQLKQLSAIAGQKILASAARAAMKPVLEEAKRLAPVRRGVLRDSLRLAARKPKSGGVVASAGVVATSKMIQQEVPVDDSEGSDVDLLDAKGAGWRWHFAEYGTSKEPAHPYLRPAMAAKQGEVIEILKAKLREKIDRAMKRQLTEAAE